MLQKSYYVYLITNWNNKVIYVGVTNNLKRRIYEHRNSIHNGFKKKYSVYKLVYFEVCDEIEGALFREKQIKAGSRFKKEQLVKDNNPDFKDLYDSI